MRLTPGVMGDVRAQKNWAGATLMGALLAGCATAEPAAQISVPALAAALAAELETLDPQDPGAVAARSDLEAIAAFVEAQAQPVVFRFDWPTPLPPGPPEPEATAFAALDPLARLPAARLVSTPSPAGLALGRFADEQMARAMWREIEGLETAALTGLEPRFAAEAGGVALLAGPLEGSAAAAERCLALTVWGLACAPAPWPEGAGGGA